MPKYTKAELHKIIDENDIKFLRLQFTDIFGILKNITVTTSKLDSVIEQGCMFDGSSIDGFARIEESDMMLIPDLDTFEIFPWSNPKGQHRTFYMRRLYAGRNAVRRLPAPYSEAAACESKGNGLHDERRTRCELVLFHKDEP